MKSNMKKVLALLLAFVLAFIPIGDIAQVKAETGYQNVTLTSTEGWSTSNDGNKWVLYLNTSGYSSIDWSYKYKGFTIDVNGVMGTTTQVSSTEDNRLYCTIPTSLVPTTDGTVFTIKAGQYAPDADNTTTGINITADFQIVVSEGRLVHTTIIDPGSAETFNNTASSFYFRLKDKSGNVVSTGLESWTNFISPSWCDNTRITQDTVSNQWSLVYSGVFIDGSPMNYWGAHFKNTGTGEFYIDGLNAVSGTTITIKGHFVSSDSAWVVQGNYYLQEMSFTYDGTNWNYSSPVEYDGVTLTSTEGWETAVNGDNWVLYLNTSSYASTDWGYKYKGFTIDVNGVTATTSQVSSTENNRLYCTIPTSIVSANNGTIFTIKAGIYAPDATSTIDGLLILNDFDVVVNEGRLMHTTVLKPDAVEAFNNSTDNPANCFYFSLQDAEGNGLTTGCESWDNFLSPAWCDGTRVAEASWSSLYTGVWVDGTPLAYWAAHFKNTAAGEFYIDGLSAVSGTTIVVRGVYDSATQANWTSVGNFYLPELTFTFDGSTWAYVDSSSIVEYEGTPVFNRSDGANGFYFSAGETEFPNDPNNWSVKAIAEDTEESGVFLNGEKTEVYLKKTNTDEWYVCLSDASVVPTTDDVITVKGTFVYTDTSAVNHRMTFTEAKFTWDGTQYKTYEEYKEYEGTPVFNRSDGANGFYFSAGETEFPNDPNNWSVKAIAEDTEESGVFLNGEKTEVYLKKTNTDEWYVCMSDAELVPEADDEITIVGSFVYTDADNVNHRITFEEATFTFNGTEYEGPSTTYNGTPVLLEIGEYGTSAGFYFSSEDGAPYATDWSLTSTAMDGDENGVFLNGTKTAINLKKTETNIWYVCIGDAGVTLNVNDVLTIKGSFKIGNTSDTVVFTEKDFVFNGKRFSDGQFTATDFTITGLAYSDIKYDTTNNRWNMYFTLSTNIPGDVDATYYPYMTYEIDGTEYTTHWFKSSSAHTVDGETIYNLYFPIEALPQTLEQEYVITVKAGTQQGRVSGTNVARTDGINLTADYQFVVGGQYEASAPTIDYLSANGGNENGIYLSSSDAFPTIGWDYSLTKSGENSGIYVDGDATEVFIKKYADNKYYVCLSDLGITAVEGTIVMMKGAFTTAGLNTVTFKTAKYIYTDGQWEIYTATVEIDSTGVWGDATGTDNLNSKDLVRVKLYLAKETEEIGLYDADLNASGNIDTYDAYMIRRLLVDDEYFRNGYNVDGVPTYTNTEEEMRLAAFVAPEYNADTIASALADYAAAGFTTVVGENRVMYDDANLEAYMQAAKNAGLDVLVQDGYIQQMAEGTRDISAAIIAEHYQELCKYDNFRGLFMGDEPVYSELSTYTQVMNTINSLNADYGKDMFIAHHPLYTQDEAVFSSDSSLSLSEKYTNYANAYGSLFGEFMYDFYPFRNKTEWSWSSFRYVEEDYMRDGWFNNLTLAATVSKGKVPTGITVQSYAESVNNNDHYRSVTKADISFQVYSALAYGMKSISYFTYDEHWDSSVGTTDCMIYNGQKTAIYNAVQDVNEEIKAIDHIMLNFNWQGTIGFSGDNSDSIMNYVADYTSPRINMDNTNATNDAIIGCLKDLKGYDGFMLVNATDPSDNKSATVNVKFNDADHAKVYIDGVESTVVLTDGAYSVTLDPGQGIFVIPYIAE